MSSPFYGLCDLKLTQPNGTSLMNEVQGGDTCFGVPDAGFSRTSLTGPSPDPDPWDAAAMAGFDAEGVNPFEAGSWAPVPDSAHCPLRYSRDPAHAGLDWTWKPCPSGNPGCESLVVDWAAPGSQAFDFDHDGDAVRVVDGRAYFSYRRFYTTSASQLGDEAPVEVDVVHDLAGGPVFAVGGFAPETRWCLIPPLAVGEYGVGYLASIGAQQWFPFPAWASWGDLTTLTAASPAGRTTGTLGRDLTRMGATQMYGGRSIFDIPTQRWSTPRVCGDPVLDGPVWPVPGGVIVAFAPTGSELRFVAADGSSQLLASPETGQDISWLMIDRSQANAIVWVESSGVRNAVLWSSPFTSTAAGLAMRKVASPGTLMPPGQATPGGGMVANAGVTAFVADDSTVLVTRLSDGWSWLIPFEPGMVPERAVWIDDQEVWIATRLPKEAPRSYTGLVRLSRGALGAPTIPPGL